MNTKSGDRRCSMFEIAPVERLSMPTTASPRAVNASDRCEPMNPAAPVMTILGKSVKSSQYGQPHDLQIERQRPVLNVVEIELDALFERRVAPPAVDLGPARDAGLHFVAKHVLRYAVL